MKERVTSHAQKMTMALVLALALCLSFGLTACGGKSNEDIIREGVTKEFESIKNLDDAALSEVMEGFTSEADLSELGVDNEEFIRSWLSGFDYTVDDVKVDGNNATVTATITVKDLATAMTDWQTEIEKLFSSSNSNMTTDEMTEKMGSTLMDAIDNAKLQTSTVELPYVLNGNTWEPGANFQNALFTAFLGSGA